MNITCAECGNINYLQPNEIRTSCQFCGAHFAQHMASDHHALTALESQMGGIISFAATQVQHMMSQMWGAMKLEDKKMIADRFAEEVLRQTEAMRPEAVKSFVLHQMAKAEVWESPEAKEGLRKGIADYTAKAVQAVMSSGPLGQYFGGDDHYRWRTILVDATREAVEAELKQQKAFIQSRIADTVKVQVEGKIEDTVRKIVADTMARAARDEGKS